MGGEPWGGFSGYSDDLPKRPLTAAVEEDKPTWNISLSFQHQQEPPHKKLKSATSDPVALCASVSGDYVAVGYHSDGLKLFSLESGLHTELMFGIRQTLLSHKPSDAVAADTSALLCVRPWVGCIPLTFGLNVMSPPDPCGLQAS